jgi:hypothetical protein
MSGVVQELSTSYVYNNQLLYAYYDGEGEKGI